MNDSMITRSTKSMDALFNEARDFGTVDIFSSREGTYSVNITFPTPAYTEVKARSGYDHKTPHLALQFAIDKAHEIRKAFK